MNRLSVDFDGTLFSCAYPGVGKQRLVHRLVTAYVKRKQRQGWIIILNTMREPYKGLDVAVEACKSVGIYPDYVNENPKEMIDKWGDSRKIGCTLSIDDNNVGLIGWILRRNR